MKKLILLVSAALLVSQPASATHYYKTIVADQYTKKICIGFSHKVDRTWERTLSDAIDKYNSAFRTSTNLGFCYNPHTDANIYKETYEVRVTVKNYGNTSWDGMAEPPHKRRKTPGDWIKINTNRLDKLEYSERVSLVMHEIGHIIGLCHTNEPRGCKSIPGTDTRQLSLFREQTGDNGIKKPVFSTHDKIAIKYMY